MLLIWNETARYLIRSVVGATEDQSHAFDDSEAVSDIASEPTAKTSMR
jgi:hypothetical protein